MYAFLGGCSFNNIENHKQNNYNYGRSSLCIYICLCTPVDLDSGNINVTGLTFVRSFTTMHEHLREYMVMNDLTDVRLVDVHFPGVQLPSLLKQ